jgi:2-(1,2-epoxy-1,2-dihydrophenyl)acetyl-CoA isomerase
MADDLSLTLEEHVAVVEIHRGPANYFDHDLLAQIADLGEELQGGRECRAIVLCSEGKHFCAGADFGQGALAGDRDRASRALYEQGQRLFELALPLVAAVQGSAVGGGLGLACAADFRVASRQTRFHANFSALGFHHGFGLTATLPRIVGPQRAHDLLLTASRIDGDRAHEIGLVDRLVEPGQERAGAVDLARDIASRAPLAVRAIKASLRRELAGEVAAALAHELAEQHRLWRTKDSQIGIAASLAREQPTFTGE